MPLSINPVIQFFQKPIFKNFKFIYAAWIIATVVGGITAVDYYNNYMIFSHSVSHFFEQKPLYLYYPNEYVDRFLFGPLFCVFSIPLEFIFNRFGAILWNVLNTSILFFAIKKLPVSDWIKIAVYWWVLHDILVTSYSFEINTTVAACILLSYIFVEEEKEYAATFFVVAGMLVKIYPVVGFAFFLFSKHKGKYILWTGIWLVLLFALPMIFTSYEYIISQYQLWFETLQDKNYHNTEPHRSIDYSVMGIVRKVSGIRDIPNLPFLVLGAVGLLIPLFKYKLWNSVKAYRTQYVPLLLITIIIFSTGAESPTYVIGATGAYLSLMLKNRPFSTLDKFLLFFVLFITTAIPSSLIPGFFREFINEYSLRALPLFCVWLKGIYDLWTFEKKDILLQP